MKVIIIYGSANDKEFMKPAHTFFDEKSVTYEDHVMSAHRNLPELIQFLRDLNGSGEKAVILAVAGLAAALPGVVAVETELPCVGVPVPGGPLKGIDALLAMSQVPGGVPVGCVGIHSKAPLNAAMYAYRILKFAGLE